MADTDNSLRGDDVPHLSNDAALDMELRHHLLELDVNLNIETQLIAVYGLLEKTKEADSAITREIKDHEEFIKGVEGDHAQQHAINNWVDCLHEATYHGAAHSMAALGMLAPLVESLFHQYLRAICAKCSELGIALPAHDRWNGSPEKAADCHCVLDNGKFSKDICRGIGQLIEALGLRTYLPEDINKVISALFLYRNKMFHSGFEWPMEERTAFERAITSQGFPPEWFSKATSGNDPWIFYMSEVLVSKVISTIGGVLDGLSGYIRDKITPVVAAKYQDEANI